MLLVSLDSELAPMIPFCASCVPGIRMGCHSLPSTYVDSGVLYTSSLTCTANVLPGYQSLQALQVYINKYCLSTYLAHSYCFVMSDACPTPRHRFDNYICVVAMSLISCNTNTDNDL